MKKLSASLFDIQSSSDDKRSVLIFNSRRRSLAHCNLEIEVDTIAEIVDILRVIDGVLITII